MLLSLHNKYTACGKSPTARADEYPFLHNSARSSRETEYMQHSKNILCSNLFHSAITGTLDCVFSLTQLRVSPRGLFSLQIPWLSRLPRRNRNDWGLSLLDLTLLPDRPHLYQQTAFSSLPFMSHTHPIASSSSSQSSNFQLILINALDEYKKRTKKDLLQHPLVTELQSCNSPSAILAVLQRQLQGIDQSRRNDERWTRWLDPTVNVLYTFSGTLGQGVGTVCLRS